MSSAVTASILVIGLAGMLVAEYTPFFDAVGYLFYPVTWLLRLPEPMLAAKAAAIEIAEMFLPSMLVVKSDMVTKFTIAVTSVSAILFFSASIPCLLSTDIPVKMKDIFLIWFERTVLSLIMAAAIGFIFF
jgi:nucleoside recognition membrane protein YjiH